MQLKHLKGLLNQITKVNGLSLTVINSISEIGIFCLEKIHDWENLSIIGDESLTNGV